MKYKDILKKINDLNEEFLIEFGKEEEDYENIIKRNALLEEIFKLSKEYFIKCEQDEIPFEYANNTFDNSIN